MKKFILAAFVFAFVAAPLIACDDGKDEAKSPAASLSTPKTKLKAHAKGKGLKTVVSAQSEKAKL